MHKIVLGALALAASATLALAAEPMTKDDSDAMGDTKSMESTMPKTDDGGGDAMMSDDKAGADMKADDKMIKDDKMMKDDANK